MQVDREFDESAEQQSWHAGILQMRLKEKVTDSWNSQEDVSDAERVLQMSQHLQELIENRCNLGPLDWLWDLCDYWCTIAWLPVTTAVCVNH
jgi:hypothetical protein